MPPRKLAAKSTAKAKASETQNVKPLEMKREGRQFCIVGDSPFLYHKKSLKTWRNLLLPAPPGRKKLDRIGILKHEPMAEFRESVYRTSNPKNATLLQFPAAAFHRAMASAALDMPGMARAEIGRWVWVRGVPADSRAAEIEATNSVNMYGVPQITLDMVKNLGINRAPDVRCKAILPEWCCEIVVHYVTPNLNLQGIINLLTNAGLIIGVGDGRQEKGILSYGQFRVVNPDDKDFIRIKTGGRVAQEAAMANPEPFSELTSDLLGWFDEEIERRRQSGGAPVADEYAVDEEAEEELES
jgi:hypothetical protein